MTKTLWLRSEYKAFEERTPLTPEVVGKIISAGFRVVVEESKDRVFKNEEYLAQGAEIVKAHSWEKNSEKCIVLGLKEIPNEIPIHGTHIYFAHIFKKQTGHQETFKNLDKNQGTLFDLEFLKDDRERRIAAFGFWAGYVGTGIAAYLYGLKQREKNYNIPLKSYPNKEAFLESIHMQLKDCSALPHTLVIGAKGRCGQGAIKLCRDLNLPCTPWDRKETSKGGPFEELLNHQIFVNSVYLTKKIDPFLDHETLKKNKFLSLIADISCDPNGPWNPLPIYDSITTIDKPLFQLKDYSPQVDILAIDHLPSLLPRESSSEYCDQLYPHILDLLKSEGELPPVWKGALETFNTKKLEALEGSLSE